jgi:hypothetical protein
MNYKYNYILVTLSIVLVILLIINCQYIGVVEDFTPGIRQLYRPHLRKCRNTVTNVYENFKTKTYKYLKKSSLI